MSLEHRFHLAGPVFVRERTRGTRVQNAVRFGPVTEDLGRSLPRELPDSDNNLRLHRLDQRVKRFVAGAEDAGPFRLGELLGNYVPAGLVHEEQRAIVVDVDLIKEPIGGAKTPLRPAPEPFAAPLSSGQPESENWALRMLRWRSTDFFLNPHPVPHRDHIAERNSSLRHPERAGVHADEENPRRRARVAIDEGLVRHPRVLKRVVDIRDVPSEREGLHRVREVPADRADGLHGTIAVGAEQTKAEGSQESRRLMPNSWYHRPKLHSPGHGPHRRAGWLELFYDLIFVATLIQLGNGLANNVSVAGYSAFVALFIPIWLLWTSVTFFTNRFVVDDFTHRTLIFAQLFAIGSMAVHVGDVVHGDTKAFALSFGIARLIVTLFYARVWHGVPEARDFGRHWTMLLGFESLLWVVSAFLPHPFDYMLWVGGVAVALSAPLSRHSREIAVAYPADAVHLSERYGLFTLIVTGEAFLKVLAHVSAHHSTANTLVYGALALLVSVCVWWIYFDDVAGSRIRRTPGSVFVWIYSHLPLAVGITALGVALKKVVDFPLSGALGESSLTSLWLLSGTLALVFMSVAAIDSVTERRDTRLTDRFRVTIRVASALVVLLIATASGRLSGIASVLLMAVICVIQVAADMMMSPEKMDLELLEEEPKTGFGPVAHSVPRVDARVRRDGGEPVLHATPSELRSDLYFFLMAGSWYRVFGVLGTAYIVVNLIFASLYLLQPGSIGGLEEPSFLDAFSFSVQTISTIGFGGLAPGSVYGDLVVAIEAAIGLLAVAVVTGVVFAKFSQPQSFVLFSRHPVITTRNGRRTLMFRLGNVRGNEVIDARISVTALIQETSPEGHSMRTLYDLKLRRDHSPMFAISWTVIHEIDDESPLYGVDLSDPRAPLQAIIASMTGHDATYAQTTHARHIFYPESIREGYRQVDVISTLDDGRLRVDYAKFHDVVPDDGEAPVAEE